MSDYERYTTPEGKSLGDAEDRAKKGQKLEQAKGPGTRAVETKKKGADKPTDGITGNTSLKSDGTSGG